MEEESGACLFCLRHQHNAIQLQGTVAVPLNVSSVVAFVEALWVVVSHPLAHSLQSVPVFLPCLDFLLVVSGFIDGLLLFLGEIDVVTKQFLIVPPPLNGILLPLNVLASDGLGAGRGHSF